MNLKTAYRANPIHGLGPKGGSYAWKVEEELRRRFRVRHAVVMSSGTAALHSGLRFLNLTGEDEIITSPVTFAATAGAIVLAGGVPVFADVDASSYCVTPETVKTAITKHTRGILAVHLFGTIADIAGLSSFGLPVMEDAAQAVGCNSHGQYSGSLGLWGAYSFGGQKQVSVGEGGALVTNSDEVAESTRLTMNHGECFGGPVGYNYRPNEITCRLILRELAKLRDNTPFKRPYLVENRGPDDRPYINEPISELPAFKKYARGPLPVAEDLCRRSLCIR
jgi:dTDP-4-amino-4,6-dideoxygalactose transaminase